MSTTGDATSIQNEFSLELDVAQQAVVRFSYEPAPCLSVTRPIYGKMSTPGAGKIVLSLGASPDLTQIHSNESYNSASTSHDGPDAVLSSPNNVMEGRQPCPSPSIADNLVLDHGPTSSIRTPSRPPSTPPRFATSSEVPVANFAAKPVDCPTAASQQSRRKRVLRETEEVDSEGEGEDDHAHKKSRLYGGQNARPPM